MRSGRIGVRWVVLGAISACGGRTVEGTSVSGARFQDAGGADVETGVAEDWDASSLDTNLPPRAQDGAADDGDNDRVALGETSDAASTRVTTCLASGQVYPIALAVNDSTVYWTTGFPDADIEKVPASGGTPFGIASGQYGPRGIAANGANAYWTTFTGSIMTVPIDGGVPVVAAQGNAPIAIALTATTMYWTDSVPQGVVSAPLGSTSASQSQLPFDVDVQPQSVAVDSTGVYWTMYGVGTVMKASLDLRNVTTLATGALAPYGIAVDVTNVYWTDALAGTITKVPKDGGTSSILASGQVGPQSIVVDSNSIYWTNTGSSDDNYTDGAILKMDIDGGAPSILAVQNHPLAIAVDDDSVYWTSDGDGTVMKMTPK
jgi:hypothetical protein